jgi:general secretion pathway protein G
MDTFDKKILIDLFFGAGNNTLSPAVIADVHKIEKTENASGYPKSLDLLVRGVVDKKDPKSKKIFFLRRIPLDPMMSSSMTKDAKEMESYGWGLRSYDSEPDAPSSGNDVFDIYSNSKGIGLNSIPYNKW